MRVLHVVTYVSADGAFGGPLAVACAQAAELARRGHDVRLVAGWDGVAQLELPGVRVELHRARRLGGRLATLISPGLWSAALKAGRSADVVHVHMGRDFVTLGAARAALLGRARLLVQPHGMVIPDRRAALRLIDAVLTRDVLTRSDTVLALTALEAGQIAEVAPASHVERLNNGIASERGQHRGTPPQPLDVLFLARLQARKRVMVFAEVARRILATGRDVRFSVVGPDEGDLEPLLAFAREHGLEQHLVYEGALAREQVRARLRAASLYVLPSIGEVFPMTVLEAMDEGVPTVVTESCGIADDLRQQRAAMVVGTTVESLEQGVLHLIDDVHERARLSEAGPDAIVGSFGIAPVVDRLLSLYRSDSTPGR